jgi:sulfite reductase alpha subunit-like flavoprotein
MVPSMIKIPRQTLLQRPLILVCTGASYAPFRALLQRRLELLQVSNNAKHMIAPIHFFYGCENEETWLFFRDEIKQFVDSGLISTVEVTYSAPNGAGTGEYVQQRLFGERWGALVYEWMQPSTTAASATLYCCGNPKGIGRTFHSDVIQWLQRQQTTISAERTWERWKAEGRVFLEFW